jgi:hypothetical protein
MTVPVFTDDGVSPGRGKNRTDEIVWSCPLRVRIQAYVATSQSLIDRSVEHDAR